MLECWKLWVEAVEGQLTCALCQMASSQCLRLTLASCRDGKVFSSSERHEVRVPSMIAFTRVKETVVSMRLCHSHGFKSQGQTFGNPCS